MIIEVSEILLTRKNRSFWYAIDYDKLGLLIAK